MAQRVIAVCGGLLCLALCSPASAQLVFDAAPTIKVESGDEATTRFVLTKKEQMDYRITIVQREGRYYWASRENRELNYRPDGAFHTFVGPGGNGYVRVFDTHYLPEAMRPPGPRYHYMEHLTLMLATITYWGTSDEFDPVHDRPAANRH